MPVVNLTAQFIKGIRPPKSGRVEYWDRTTPGLCLRVTSTGAHSFSYRYRPREGGKQNERITFGDLPIADARDRAAAVRAKVIDGGNPQLSRRQKREAAKRVFTLNNLVDRYIADAKARKASWKDDEQRLVRVRAEFGDREAASIRREFRREFILFLDDLKREAPVQANRIQSVTSTMFNWAVESELLDANPIAGLRKRAKETAKSRTLTDAEIRVLWRALERTEETSRDIADALRVVLSTGLRPGEAAGLQQRDVVNGERLEIPAERMKARRPHVVPLCPMARSIIEGALERRRDEGSKGGVFGSRFLARETLARHTLSQALRRVIARLKPESKADAEVVRDIQENPPTPHDFRRTCATGLAALGIAREDRLAVLAHVAGDVHGQHYDMYERLREKRIALATWERHIGDLITGTTTATAEILPMQAVHKHFRP
jgi:integrase